mmetsp:Transcript_21850/g.54477  ORF Transcript_21850/g.54477 Transcript_21850/m.54477 type:complete len:123 (+) Transcript_21850:401-769(+)
MRDARSWDAFIMLVHSVRPFERDDADYRRMRAVETFNAARVVMAEYKRLVPAIQSACPHVALCVVPRQMVEHGDPGRRGTDHSEAYGASIKDSRFLYIAVAFAGRKLPKRPCTPDEIRMGTL